MEMEHKLQNGHQYVKEVLEKKYRIPKYQRGYRWTETNVEKLLQDVYEKRLYVGKVEELESDTARAEFREITFEARDEKDKYRLSIPKNPYCIQPLVVTMREENLGEYDVIDGQQRLTTIVIIRAALKWVFGLEKIEAPIIEYESRENTRHYLEKLYKENICGCEMPEDNIDFAYMKQAYDTAVEFYTACKLDIMDDEIQKLYGKYLDAVLCENTRFIWYEVPQNAPQKVFANFNTGKIELTNAELIKALFMNPENYQTEILDDRQIVISEKWDEIENQLHNEDFWAFVPHPNQYRIDIKEYGTRIDLLFDFLVMDNWLEKTNKTVADYLQYREDRTSDRYIFDEIESWILEKLNREPENKNKIMDECWRCVGKIFSNFREIYSDTKLYNSVGLYINLRSREFKTVDSYVKDKRTYLEIYGELKDITKSPRNCRLQLIKEKISKIVFPKGEIENKLKTVRYSDGNNADIVNLLMVYNIALLSNSKSTGERFNYLANACNKWQREHIFATNVNVVLTDEERETALKILVGDSYFEYLRYIYPNFKTKNFMANEMNYIFDVNKPEENAKEFMDTYIANSANYEEGSWARAIKAKRDAKKLIENRKYCKRIESVLAVKEDTLRKELMSYYVEQFGERFFWVENISLDQCWLNIEKKIFDAKVCEESKKAIITIKELDFVYEYDFTTEKNILSPSDWNTWLQVLEEGKKENYQKVKNKLQDKYVEELKKKEFDKMEFWEQAFYLHKRVLERSIDEFFGTNLLNLVVDNSMGNMTLLTGNMGDESRIFDKESAGQNQSVGDMTYKKKKEEVYKFYKKGQFVPLGSLFVFTDLYTKAVNASSLWLPDSRLAYLKDMIKTVEKYLEGEGK